MEEIKDQKMHTVYIIDWKPYPIEGDVQSFFDQLFQQKNPPFERLHLACSLPNLERFTGKEIPPFITLGALSMPSVAESVFTAPIAGKILNELGAQFVVIGSFFERSVYASSPEEIKAKVRTSLNHGLIPLLCVPFDLPEGEQLATTVENVKDYLNPILEGMTPEELDKIYFVLEITGLKHILGSNADHIEKAKALFAKGAALVDNMAEGQNLKILIPLEKNDPLQEEMAKFTHETELAQSFPLLLSELSFHPFYVEETALLES